MVEQQKRPIAVKKRDLDMFGCPECGRRGLILERYGRSGLWHCQDPDCNYKCIALVRGSKKSCLGIEFLGVQIYPELQVHPRKGTPARNGISIEERFDKLGLREL